MYADVCVDPGQYLFKYLEGRLEGGTEVKQPYGDGLVIERQGEGWSSFKFQEDKSFRSYTQVTREISIDGKRYKLEVNFQEQPARTRYSYSLYEGENLLASSSSKYPGCGTLKIEINNSNDAIFKKAMEIATGQKVEVEVPVMYCLGSCIF